jgi:hypothetical protein
MVQATLGGAKSLTEQTFLKGLNSASEAINDPERYGEYFASNLTGSVVPTIVADIARAGDEKERRTESLVQGVKVRIPGARNTLEPKVDVFGKELPRYGGNILEVMVDPTRPSKVKGDIVVDEIKRLSDQDKDVTPTLLGTKEGYKGLTPEQHTRLWKTAGNLTYKNLFKMIGTKGSAFSKMNDANKAKMIKKITGNANSIARASMVNELLRSLPVQERKTKFQELYKDHFITEDVAKIYSKYFRGKQ